MLLLLLVVVLLLLLLLLRVVVHRMMDLLLDMLHSSGMVHPMMVTFHGISWTTVVRVRGIGKISGLSFIERVMLRESRSEGW